MTTSAPPRSLPPPNLPTSVVAETRLRSVEAQLAHCADDQHRAVLQYEAGALLEHRMGDRDGALRHYLAAFNSDQRFRPPLFALLRTFHERRSLTNWERTLHACVKSARTAAERATFMVAQASFLMDRLHQPERATRELEEALSIDPDNGLAGWMLEYLYRAAGRRVELNRLVEVRALQTDDPVLKACLLGEVAEVRARGGDTEGALQILRGAAAPPTARYQAYRHMERIAREGERPQELAEALQGAAEAVVSELERVGRPGDRFESAALASRHAVGLLQQAAWVRARACAEPTNALQLLDRALTLRPDDPVLLFERLRTSELAADPQAAGETATRLLRLGIRGPLAAALHFRRAEAAKLRGDADLCEQALLAAVEEDHDSAATLSVLEQALVERRRWGSLCRLLERRAGREPDTAAPLLFRAAYLALNHTEDSQHGRTWMRGAIEETPDAAIPLRELYGWELRRGRRERAMSAAAELCEEAISDGERSALYRQRYKHALDRADAEAADRILRLALQVPGCNDWAPDAARLRGAIRDDRALLDAAHRALAERALDPGLRAAHLCAAARAQVRSRDNHQAIELLRGALDAEPGNPYAVALLEELLLAEGAASEVVALLRDAAVTSDDARHSELSLLHAGDAAEAAGDVALAARSYEDAADQGPPSVAPLWALRRLGDRTHRADLRLNALQGLALYEDERGAPGLFNLELAEQLDVIGKSELAAAPLAAALGHEQYGLAAALALALLPQGRLGSAERDAGLALLSEHSVHGERFAYERIAESLTTDPSRARALLAPLTRTGGHSPWAALAELLSSADTQSRAYAYSALADASDDRDVAAQLQLHAIRVAIAADPIGAVEDEAVHALEIAQQAPESLAAAVALDETLSAGDDADARADALSARLAGASDAARPRLRAGLARALLLGGHGREALSRARELLDHDPDDIASWELSRAAGHLCGRFDAVVEACEALANHCEGEVRAALLEEAALLWEDELGREDEAERLLRESLGADPFRDMAFNRLHDLLLRRKDAIGLLELLAARIAQSTSTSERVDLLYEQARILRGLGEHGSALQELQRLLTVAPAHVGGLSLLAEIHATRAEWKEAVEALRRLAACDVPTAQKALARKGAADFLERRLDDPAAAYRELAGLAVIGLADATLYERMAILAEQAAMWPEAVRAHLSAATHTAEAQRAMHERRAGALQAKQLGQVAAAIASFQRALDAQPTDVEACGALLELIVDPVDRGDLLRGFTATTQRELRAAPAEPGLLRALVRAARWADDRCLQHLALDALHALGMDTPQERAARRTLIEAMRPVRARMGATDLDALRGRHDRGQLPRIAQLVAQAVARMERPQASDLGVDRKHRIRGRTPHPLQLELQEVLGVFGLTLNDLYVGGPRTHQVQPVATAQHTLDWVAGEGVESPLNAAQRFEIGFCAMAAREGILPLLRRPVASQRLLVLAAADAAEWAIAEGQGTAEQLELSRALQRSMPRQLRSELHEVLRQRQPSLSEIDTYLRSARSGALRAGLLLGGDLRIALTRVLGEHFDTVAVAESAQALDLLRVWTSATMLRLRRLLGVGP